LGQTQVGGGRRRGTLQERWIGHRSTAEVLKDERYLYLARAGPYVGEDRHKLLAERIEGLISKSMPSGRTPANKPPSGPKDSVGQATHLARR
jgi:hypothetical protein